jgi:hypothetical protein
MSTFRFNLYYRSGALAVDRCALEVESVEQATEIFLRLTSEGFGVVVYDEAQSAVLVESFRRKIRACTTRESRSRRQIVTTRKASQDRSGNGPAPSAEDL